MTLSRTAFTRNCLSKTGMENKLEQGAMTFSTMTHSPTKLSITNSHLNNIRQYDTAELPLLEIAF